MNGDSANDSCFVNATLIFHFCLWSQISKIHRLNFCVAAALCFGFMAQFSSLLPDWQDVTFDSLPAVGPIQSRTTLSNSTRVHVEAERSHDRLLWSTPECHCSVFCLNRPRWGETAPGFEVNRLGVYEAPDILPIKDLLLIVNEATKCKPWPEGSEWTRVVSVAVSGVTGSVG